MYPETAKPWPFYTNPNDTLDYYVRNMLQGYPGSATDRPGNIAMPQGGPMAQIPLPQQAAGAKPNFYASMHGGDFLDALLQVEEQRRAGRPAPGPSAPLSVGGAFPGPPPSPVTGKLQDRLPGGASGMPYGFDPGPPTPHGAGMPWFSPSARPQAPGGAAPGGASGGAPPGAAAPQQEPSGPLTWQQVVRGMIDANKELAKTKHGMAIIGQAAAMYLPLMQQQSQQEFKMIQQRLQLELQFGRLRESEAKTRLAEERLERGREAAAGKSTKELNKNYTDAAKEVRFTAKAMHEAPNDPNLKRAYADAVNRFMDIKNKIYGDISKQQGSDIQKYITTLKAQNASMQAAVPQIIKGIPANVRQKLTPALQEKLARTMWINPEAVDELLAELSGTSGVREGTTEVPKSGGYYR